MFNKKLIFLIAIILMIVSFAGTVFFPEKDIHHSFFHLFLISIIMLSLFISMKTIFNIIMIFSAFIWALTFFDILLMVQQLLVETLIIIFSGVLLGWYEVNFKHEKKEVELIISYKRKENDKLQQKINEKNSENESLMNEIKEYRKKLIG